MTTVGGKITSQGFLVDSFNYMMSFLDCPSKLLYGVTMILIIVYSSEIPVSYRIFADSILGRVFGIAVVYGTIEMVGWTYGLLTALALLFLIAGASRDNLYEHFDGGGTVSEKRVVGKRWFVEKVLGEKPSKIATDKAITHTGMF